MKKVLQGLFSVKAFRNNYLAAATITALFTLLQVSVYAQPNSPSASAPKYDTTRILQPINADGFYWTGVGKFGGGLVLPNDTFHLSIQSKGALAYKNGKVYEYEGHYWEEAGFKRWFVSPDGSINITNNGDTIKATVTGAPNSSSPGNYIITYPTIERSNDTVDVIPNIVFQQGSLRDTITTGAQYVVPYASAGQKRIDPIIIDPSGLLDTLQGVEDSFFAVRPDLAAGSIVIADINVYGVDSIVVSNVGLFQSTAMGYFDSNGKLTGDSTKYFVGSNTLNAPSFKSNVVGGVALSIDGGSAIRADRGSRIVYIDGDSSVTLRSGGYNHKAQLTAQGEFLIGSSGQVRIPSARLAVIDSTKGFLPPVMRGVRMNAISSPATGLIVYNSDSASLCLYNGSAWVKLGTGGGSGGSQDLQSVLENGDTTNQSISINYHNGFTPIAGVKLESSEVDAEGKITITSGVGVTASTIYSTSNIEAAGGGKTFFPDAPAGTGSGIPSGSPVFVRQVNGVNADESGNVSVSASGNLQEAYDAAPSANPQINIVEASEVDRKILQSQRNGRTGIIGFKTEYPYLRNISQTNVNNLTEVRAEEAQSYKVASDSTFKSTRHENYPDSVIQRANGSSAANKSILFQDTAKIIFCTVQNNGKVGINTTAPDSTLTVVGGVAMPNLYESSDVTDSMVVKNADGGLGIRAIPGGGSTTDSVQIGNDWFYTKKITLTPSEILTLNTVPVEAIAAPGAGKAIDVISVSGRLVPNSVSYSTGVNPTIICNAVNLFACPLTMNESATIGSKFTPESAIGNFIENAPVFISSTADEQDGDGNLFVYLYYRIITL